MPDTKKTEPETDPNRPHLSAEDLAAEKRSLEIDEHVRRNRETNDRVGGNDVEPGQYEAPSETALEPEPTPEPMTNEENEEKVKAMDAHVAASTGAAQVNVTTGAATSANAGAEPAKKAPARGKSTK
jgi:hypothetical protein